MTDFATELRRGNTDLEIGALDWAIALAPQSVAIPTSYTDSSGVITPPVGFVPVGNLDKKAAVKIASAITSTPVETYGEQTATRIIRKSRDITVDFTMQQTSLIVLSAYWGQDFTGTTSDPSSGETHLVINETSHNVEYRLVMIGFDGEDAAEIYTIIDAPRATLSKSGDITTNDDGIAMYPVTLQLLKDTSTYNYATRITYAGPGWKPLAPAAGFAAPATSIDVDPATATLATGNFMQLTVVDNNGVDRTADCTFTSATPADVTVTSPGGVVTAVATGSSVITAHLGSLTDTTTITVS